MTDARRISVVTPSFNQSAYVQATLDSVVSQGYPELEYVVIDGGSTDGSVEIIERYREHLSYFVSEPDHGHADALNKGFAHTAGEVMGWINSSDLYYPWTLQTVAEIFTDLPDVEWIMGMPSQFAAAGGPRSVSRGTVNVYDILAGHYRAIQQESVFWRRRLWERAGGRVNTDWRHAADFDLWLRFMRLAPLHHVDTVLAGFRVHDDRLGDAGDGPYQREAADLHARFVAGSDRQALHRARMVRFVGPGRRKVVAEVLHKSGLWPWYRQPRVSYDFARETWVRR